MANKTYRAAIEHGDTIEVLSRGAKAKCVGALEAWNRYAPADEKGKGVPLLLVEVDDPPDLLGRVAAAS